MSAQALEHCDGHFSIFLDRKTKLKSKFKSLIIFSLWVLFLCRHMLNVTWEHNDFSFNSNGYLVNPAMIIITLDRERQWDKVSFAQDGDRHTEHKIFFALLAFVYTPNGFLCDDY